VSFLARAHHDAPAAPIRRMELGLAAALLGAMILVATLIVPMLA
jgi:hypothetical protein